MQFSSPLLPGTLFKRYKRFFADVRLENGQVVTAHCPNTGSMLGCSSEGNPVLLSQSENPNRKLSYTWELIRMDDTWVGISTGKSNAIVHEALERRTIPELEPYTAIEREVTPGIHKSRLDFLLTGPKPCYVEVKQVTLKEGKTALFPDAVTERGARHLSVLQELAGRGYRVVIFFLLTRGDCSVFKLAVHIGAVYAASLVAAVKAGVTVLCYASEVSPMGITVAERVSYDGFI